ncbi:MAG: hypothetical protein JWL84_5453, partial [Rhodospirillales bacterium]|nr:hypothetical protein [Rhodospirillales bacterium]
ICCTFANHIIDILVDKYAKSDPIKLHGNTDLEKYRAYIFPLCPEAEIIRDLCDYGKHGSSLGRKSVSVSSTDVGKTLEGDYGAFAMGVYNHIEVEKIIITMKDGSERWFDACIETVNKFWQVTFAADSL